MSLVATRVSIESRLLMGILSACSPQSRTLGSKGYAAEEKPFLMSALVCLVSHMSFSCCPYHHVDALDDTSAERMPACEGLPRSLSSARFWLIRHPRGPLLTRNTFFDHLDDVD